MNSPLPEADEPLLIISGLPSSEPTPAWVQAWSSAGVAQWVPPQALLGPRGAALADSHARIVWLYRAPWGSVGPAGMRLGSWLSLQRQALRQRGQNPGAWVLVNADRLDPEALADHLGVWVDAPVGDSAASAQSIEADQQQLLWARLFEWAAPQAWDMYEALEAATWAAPGQPAPMLREELPAPEPAAVEALQRKLQEAEEHQAQAQRWQARAIELEAAEQARAEAAQQLADAQALTSQRETQLKEAQEEGELLLLQLHQVQEELEQLFLQGKEKEAAAAQATASAQASAETAQGAAAQAQAAAAEAKAAASQAQAERDQARQDLSVRTAERDQARESLQAARALAAQQQAESQAAAAQREAQLKESQEEGELLLLQLHQVQEELETHFLRGKDLEQQLQSVRARYQRLQSRYPQAVDVDAVEVEKTDPSAKVPFVAWRLKGLSVGGTVWPELVLHTSLEPAGAGVRLEAPAASAIARGMDGPLVPKALTARDAAQMERFRGIGQQAWQVLIAACAAVDEVLGAPASAVPGAPTDFDPTFWRQSLGALAPVLRGLPPVFRHDGVRLKREKVNPDYEHLWLVFEGAAFGAQPMPGFEMRLGAAQTQLAGFSHLPKLEFPLGANGKPPFEGWFEESRDDFGPKFELRADLKREMFDLGVWARVPKTTQAMLLSLIAAQPSILEAIEHQGSRLSRPWSD
jgi:hypothetical protein